MGKKRERQPDPDRGKPKQLRKRLRKAEDQLADAILKRDRAQARVEALSIIADEIRAQIADADKAAATAADDKPAAKPDGTRPSARRGVGKPATKRDTGRAGGTSPKPAPSAIEAAAGTSQIARTGAPSTTPSTRARRASTGTASADGRSRSPGPRKAPSAKAATPRGAMSRRRTPSS